MVYIRPPARILPATAIKPIGTNEPVQPQDMAVSKPTTETALTPAPDAERRKQRDRRDRRDRDKKVRDPLLETRDSKDRRQAAKPSISVTV